MSRILREKLTAGKTIVGVMMTWFTDEAYLPVFQDAGYDFIMLDCEHGSCSWEQVARLCRLGRAMNFPILARCHVTYETIRRCMDMGPVGIMAPMINRIEQLTIMRDAIFLPPLGRRGPGGAGREYLQSYDRSDWAAFERDLIVLPQIESRAGIELLPRLLNLDWVTGAFMGPYDLLMDMQLPMSDYCRPGSAHHAAIRRAIESCRRAGKPCGMHVVSGDLAPEWINLGCQIMICGQIHNLVEQQARRNIETIRAATKGR